MEVEVVKMEVFFKKMEVEVVKMGVCFLRHLRRQQYDGQHQGPQQHGRLKNSEKEIFPVPVMKSTVKHKALKKGSQRRPVVVRARTRSGRSTRPPVRLDL